MELLSVPIRTELNFSFVHQEVVKYMADFVANRDANFLVPKKKKRGFLFWFCSIFCPQRR